MTEQRERDRYKRRSIRGDLEEIAGWFPAHPRESVGLFLLIAAGALAWFLTPGPVRFADLRAGDCLFVRTAEAVAIGESGVSDPTEVREAILRSAMERTPCDASHSHEVAAIADLSAAAPGGTFTYDAGLLLQAADEACRPPAASYLGLAPGTASTAYRLIAVLPGELAWSRGTRTAACLLASPTGPFLSGPARGTGR